MKVFKLRAGDVFVYKEQTYRKLATGCGFQPEAIFNGNEEVELLNGEGRMLQVYRKMLADTLDTLIDNEELRADMTLSDVLEVLDK